MNKMRLKEIMLVDYLSLNLQVVNDQNITVELEFFHTDIILYEVCTY